MNGPSTGAVPFAAGSLAHTAARRRNRHAIEIEGGNDALER